LVLLFSLLVKILCFYIAVSSCLTLCVNGSLVNVNVIINVWFQLDMYDGNTPACQFNSYQMYYDRSTHAAHPLLWDKTVFYIKSDLYL